MKNELQQVRDALSASDAALPSTGQLAHMARVKIDEATVIIDRLIAEHEGKVLVPIEPTEDMLEAYKEANGDHSDWETWLEWDGGDATRLYKAMIAAAKPPIMKGE